MTFERLTRGDWVAWLSALVLVCSLAPSWYGTRLGDEARRTGERLAQPSGPIGERAVQGLERDAELIAEREDRGGLEPPALIDGVILVLLLASAGLAFAAGVARAAGRRFEPPRTPSAAAGVVATILALLLAYRMIQEPGLDAATTVKLGPLVALLGAAGVALGASRALRAEEDGSAWERPAGRSAPAAPPEASA